MVGLLWVVLCAALGTSAPRSVEGAIVLVNSSDFTPIASPITFSEVPYLTTNPTYVISNVESVGDLTVSFGSHFVGQVLGSDYNTLVDSSPTGPLTLASDPTVATVIDLAQSSIALGGVVPGPVGNAYFTTPISVHFSSPVGYVGLDLGHFDHAGTTIIEAYDAAGNSLGTLSNPYGGVSWLGLMDDSGKNLISGLTFYIAPGGMDWEGYTIDDLVFALGDDSGGGEDPDPQIPEPTSLLVWAGLAVAGLVWGSRTRRRQAPPRG
jgi:hypothetical protein